MLKYHSRAARLRGTADKQTPDALADSEPLSGRAAAVLAALRQPDRPNRLCGRVSLNECFPGSDFDLENGWYPLGRLPNVGKKTLDELITAGLIECDHDFLKLSNHSAIYGKARYRLLRA